MARPSSAEWSILGYDHDPTPGDADTVAEIGQDLRDLADLIQRQAREIDALGSVDSWQSKAAEKFRHTAHGTVTDLRKAFHRYDIAAKALGVSTEGSGYAAELYQAQTIADKALRDAQNAHTEQQNLRRQHDQLPPDTMPNDPQAASLNHRSQAAQDTIDRCRRQVENAISIQETAARRAQQSIHRAITHDGFHDKFGDKFDAEVSSIASTTLDGLNNFGEDALNIAASVGNAMLHDLGSDTALMSGLFLSALGGAGEGVGFALDLSVVGAPGGVALNLASGWLIAAGGTMAISAAGKIGWDSAHSDHIAMSTDNGSGGGGGGGELSNRVRPPQPGDREYVVHNPSDPSDTITDYDYVAPDGRLWEEKSATGQDPRMNIPKWVNKNVTKKLDSYLRGRPYAQGYENASFGLDFTEPGATPEFRAAVEQSVRDWEAKNGVDVEVHWAS